MAEENLGTAVLRIVVDDEPARNALNLLRRDVEATTQQATRARRKTARPPTPKGGAREGTDAVEKANQRIIGIQNRINLLEAKGVDITQARARLSQAIAANQQSNFGSVRQITSQLSNTLKIEEGRLRVSAAQTAQLKRQEAATKTVATTEKRRADKPTGVGFATTPEQILASRGGTQKGAATGINALESTIDKATRLRNRLNVLDAKGVDTVRLRATYEQAVASANKGELATSQRLLRNSSRQVSLAENDLKVAKLRETAEKRRLKEEEPQASKAAATQEEKRLAAARDRKAKAASQKQQGIISNAIIGGSFPLLFGQGIGASIGGAAGGAAGGAIGGQFGFGLSLVGTALGSQFDVAIQKLGAVAKALDDPIANFQTLVQNASLSSKELERYAQALIDSGRSAEAAAVIQRDLIGTFGSLQGAKEYNDAVDTISRAWSEASTALASFVAGPLAALIRTLSEPTGGLATGASFQQLTGQLSPDQYRQVQARREQVTEASRRARGGVSAILPPSNEDVNAGLRAGLALAKELLGIEKQRAELAARIAFAQVQNQKSLSTSYQLIDASTQGYERQSLELQKQKVLNERNRKLLELTDKERNNSANPKTVKIQQDAALELYDLTQKLNQLDKDRAAQKGLEAVQDKIKLQSITKQVIATQALSKAERGVARDTLAATQDIQAGIDAAKYREREISAQIEAARQRGGDAGKQEAFRLVQEQKVAANQTRLELEKGALALKEAGERLRDNLRDAVVEFTRVRSDPQGLNKFLNPEQRQKRAEFDFRTLLPQFREAQFRFTQLTGAPAPQFSGSSTARVNDSIRDFIQRVQTEREATKNLADTQQAIATNTAKLNETNTALALKIQELTKKDWAVSVTVSGGQSAISGDVLNGAVSP